MMNSLLKKMLLMTLASTLYPATQAVMTTSDQVSDSQQSQLNRVQDYLNGIRTLRANFTQSNPNGTNSSGMMYLKRLGKESFGKLRLEYGPPVSDRIIANGETLRHVDGQSKETNEYSIDSTPASFLLRHRIDFSNDLTVKSMETKGGKIYLTVMRPGDDGVTLTLIFVTSPMLRLQEWSIVDAQSNETHVVLTNVNIGLAIDEKLFRF
jgi:outer membrane lipoprotein-sorting protein